MMESMESIAKEADQDIRLLKLTLLLETAPQSIKDTIERDMMIALQMIPCGNDELPRSRKRQKRNH